MVQLFPMGANSEYFDHHYSHLKHGQAAFIVPDHEKDNWERLCRQADEQRDHQTLIAWAKQLGYTIIWGTNRDRDNDDLASAEYGIETNKEIIRDTGPINTLKNKDYASTATRIVEVDAVEYKIPVYKHDDIPSAIKQSKDGSHKHSRNVSFGQVFKIQFIEDQDISWTKHAFIPKMETKIERLKSEWKTDDEVPWKILEGRDHLLRYRNKADQRHQKIKGIKKLCQRRLRFLTTFSVHDIKEVQKYKESTGKDGKLLSSWQSIQAPWNKGGTRAWGDSGLTLERQVVRPERLDHGGTQRKENQKKEKKGGPTLGRRPFRAHEPDDEWPRKLTRLLRSLRSCTDGRGSVCYDQRFQSDIYDMHPKKGASKGINQESESKGK